MAAAAFARRYDRTILDPDVRLLYDGSDFFNAGDWTASGAQAPSALGEAARRLVERHLAIDPPKTAAAMRTILDIGCGLGPATRMMAHHYPAALVVGINISPAQLAYAARAAPSPARFAAMDAVRLAVATASVDRIHAVEAAFHFASRLDFLREAHRVLRPDGKLALSDILYRRRLPDVPVENLWRDAADYKAKCEAAGFVVESFEDITGHTATPFCNYLEGAGKKAHARALRRAIEAYYFVVLRRQSI
jgi:MPBQ/MSBQ methyltransferase